MNDLLEQFLVECRELVEAATVDLLELEASPGDQNRIDGAFRAFHTLKGAAGIVGFGVMGRVLHAAESLLDSIRTGNTTVSGDLIGECLACLDQVVRWLEEVEAKGDIPVLPDSAGDALIARLAPPEAAASDIAEPVPAGDTSPTAPDWLAGLLARHATHAATARTALRYVPDADCFFRSEDPLALVAALPDILALELTPGAPWPALEEFTPFACHLVIAALLAATPDTVATAMSTVSAQVEICPLVASPPTAKPRLSPTALAILEEQILLAANADTAGFEGRLGSAVRVASNVMNLAGWADASGALSDAFEQSQKQGSGAPFMDTLGALLDQLRAALDDGSLGDDAPAAVSGRDEHPATDAAAGPAADLAPRTQVVRALRVDADRIDALVNLTGEITVVRNAIGHTARLARDGTDPDELMRRLKDQHARLDRLVAELQRSVLGLRVLPLNHVFQHFPRLVREMAQDLAKSVRLVIEGQTTEADKATVEALFEPLLHVLRNALAHGVEPEDERIAAGKPPRATVQLRATAEGDQVIVEVIDDGRGIDVANIRRRAARLGLAAETALAEMTDQAVTELIFSPGFSTAATVTSLSGRGVGMDAVRAAVSRLGGRVSVTSQPGAGTYVRITLPFTVMLLRVMTVEAGGQSFGIPIEAVIETTRVPRSRILALGAAEAIVLRERTVPLIRLADVLSLTAPDTAPDTASDADVRIVVVRISTPNEAADDNTEQIGALQVDALGERIDVMLKPMEGLLIGVKGFAGTTLLGDGRVLIVLDLAELLR